MAETAVFFAILAALVAMFVLPYLPNWLFEGPRTIKHGSRRHICGDCHALWTSDHTCLAEASEAAKPLQAELRRPQPAAAELERWPKARISARE